MSKINAFYCPVCKKYTKHIGISAREYSALEGFDKSTEILTGLFELTGAMKLLNLGFGMGQYKCTECGHPTSRNARGGEGAWGTEDELRNG